MISLTDPSYNLPSVYFHKLYHIVYMKKRFGHRKELILEIYDKYEKIEY